MSEEGKGVSLSLKMNDGHYDLMISVRDTDDLAAMDRLTILRHEALERFYSKTLAEALVREDADSLGHYPGMPLAEDLHTVIIEPKPEDPEKVKVSFFPRLKNGAKGKWPSFLDFKAPAEWVEFFKGTLLVFTNKDGDAREFEPNLKTFSVAGAYTPKSPTARIIAVVSDRRKAEKDDGTPGNYYEDPVRIED